MFSEALEKQIFAVRVLSSHLKEKRLAHAYLLTGTRGLEGRELLLAFAGSVNCEKQSRFQFCGCGSCRKVHSQTHPDVFWIGEDLKLKSIKIEEIRNVLGSASLKSYEGRKKVFILIEADRLTTDAANAFLKTLEEPPADTLFVLCVENKFHLLETLQSRCFEIRLKPASEDSAGVWPEGLGKESWDEWLERYAAKERSEVKQGLAALGRYLRNQMKEASQAEASSLPLWLKAMERLLETQDALDANANQKLALSRLAMQLEKTVPLTPLVGPGPF